MTQPLVGSERALAQIESWARAGYTIEVRFAGAFRVRIERADFGNVFEGEGRSLTQAVERVFRAQNGAI